MEFIYVFRMSLRQTMNISPQRTSCRNWEGVCLPCGTG